jgi:peptidyl-prolyl cis-trans isomerase B (cyclophilin B)
VPNRKILTAALAAAVLMMPFAAACAQTDSGQTASHEAMNDKGETMSNPRVTLQTSKGNIVLELYADQAPDTVENFLGYVRDGFFDGTIFHRVIPGFMIQGGGFTADMQQKSTKAPIENEADNGVKNERGTIAMARTGNPHSATAQFFINTADNGPLDHTGKTPQGWGYAVFGKVVEGMDVVDAIGGVATTNRGPHQNVPAEPVIIEKATLQAAGG